MTLGLPPFLPCGTRISQRIKPAALRREHQKDIILAPETYHAWSVLSSYESQSNLNIVVVIVAVILKVVGLAPVLAAERV